MSEAVLNKLKGIEKKLDRLSSEVKVINGKLDAVIIAMHNYDEGMDLTAYGLDIEKEED
jgi:hypothetical protein